MAKSSTFLQTLVLAKQGYTVVRTATRMETSTDTVRRNLRLAGFSQDDPVPILTPSRQLQADSLVYILVMVKRGHPRSEIAQVTGRSSASVSNLVAKGGFSRASLFKCRVTRMQEVNHARPWATYCTVPLMGMRVG